MSMGMRMRARMLTRTRAMGRWSGTAGAVAIGGLLALLPRDIRAQQASERIVLTVGDRANVGAAALEARIAAMPLFQRVTFGPTPSAVVHRFVADVVIPELLVTIAAREAGLEKRPSVSLAIDRVLANATIRSIKGSLAVSSAVAAGDVRAYFEANRARYEAPERYRIARILCRTREDALAVLAAAKADSSPKALHRAGARTQPGQGHLPSGRRSLAS